jgi:hypothetical protein
MQITMMNRRSTSALIFSLVAASAGCGESEEGYIDFENTKPAPTQQQPDAPAQNAQPATTETTESPAVTPVSAASEAENSRVQQAISESATPSAVPVTPPVLTSAHTGLQGPADVPVVENSVAGETRKIELLIPEKRLRKERGTSAVRVSFDDIDLLKVLNMEPVPVDAVEYFPEWLKALDGKPVRIRGYMYPTFESTGLKSFAFVRDTGICCFQRKPKIYDIIGITMAEGVTADYMELRPFDVEGIFHIDPQVDANDLSRLYHIDNARVLE